MPEPETLENIFGAYVNQETLEQAALWMAANAESDAGYRAEVLEALTAGHRRGQAGDSSVMQAVNRSGYQVQNADEAAELIFELRALFEKTLSGH